MKKIYISINEKIISLNLIIYFVKYQYIFHQVSNNQNRKYNLVVDLLVNYIQKILLMGTMNYKI